MLVAACIWYKNSLPARFAGSPVQLSSLPKTANFVPLACKIRAMAFVMRLARSSKLPAQPTQNNTSGVSPAAVISAIVGTFNSLLMTSLYSFRQSPRVAAGNAHGAPLFSMLLNIEVIDSGDLLSSMIKLLRMSRMMPIGLISTGHACTQA